MRTSRFCFELPRELIAQRPAAQRGAARLMVLERASGALRHARVGELPAFLAPGSVVVLNDTRVLHARLTGCLAGGREVPFLLLDHTHHGMRWRALARGARQLAGRGGTVAFPDGVTASLTATEDGDGSVVLAFDRAVDAAYLEQFGSVPLPPYIDRPADAADAERYQTVFAEQPGSAAAPTAGLHFSDELLQQLRRNGIAVVQVTLHVGAGTFAPMRSERVEDHVMHRERYWVSEQAASAVEQARREHRPVVAVGTTVVRTLEAAWDGGAVRRGEGSTGLFIYPGYRFRVVDQLLTNFHTPRSSLLALVSALAGERQIRAAYATAVEMGYRFFSYGDAMLIR
jgi:S-adenosylmethionine:tRNA ribosyltransferase-isomerase